METVAIHAPELTGETGLTLYLYTEAGVLTNTGGDSLAESPASSGRFTASVAETISSIHHARVHDAVGVVRDGWLSSGGTLVRDSYPISAEASGARSVTVTVTDGTDPLENATVRMTSGLTYTATTNASGVAAFNLDDATYTVSITRSGYSYAGTTLVVDGAESVTYAMTAVSITPSSGDLTTGYLTALTEAGVAEVGATLYCAMSAPPDDDTGYSYDSTRRTITSGSGGLAQFPGLVKGATYTIWRGTKVSGDYEVTIPTTAGTTYELPSHLGKP